MQFTRPIAASMRRYSRTIAVITAIAAAPAGCSILDRTELGGAQFLLSPAEQQPVAGAAIGSVRIEPFSAVPPFDGRSFLYRTTDGTWRADAHNGFMSAPTNMLREACVRACARSGRFTLVGTDELSIRPDFTLDAVVESFFADYADGRGGTAVVELRAYLVDLRGARTRVVAQLLGRGTEPVKGETPGDVAAAFSAASSQAIHAIVTALPAEVEAPQKPAPAQQNAVQVQKPA